jgi:hypothetical protein
MLEVAVEPSLLIAGACALVDLGCALLTMSSSLSFVFCTFTGGNPQLQSVADAGRKFIGGKKTTREPWFSSSPSLSTIGDKLYRCDERDLACRADRRHDKKGQGTEASGKGEVGWHHIGNGSAVETGHRAEWFRWCRED